jgi:hypothetical protein
MGIARMGKGIDRQWVRMIKGDDPSVLRELLPVEKSIDECSHQKGEP